MADNTTLDPGAGGDTIATDDVGGIKYQWVKLADGTDGSGTKISSGGGAEAGALRVTLASDSTGVVSVDDNGGSLTVDGSVSLAAAIPAGTNNIGDVDIASALPAGNNNIGDVDVASLPALPAGTNNIGDVDVLTIAAGTNAIGNVGLVPRTTGGLSASANLIDIDETEDEVKGTAGQVFGYYFYNDGSTEVYVKFYNNTAAGTTVGSTTPAFTIPIPAGSAANLLSGMGIAFSTGITIAATTGVAVADTGAPAANQVVGVVFYA
jgi:hypothetical protein